MKISTDPHSFTPHLHGFQWGPLNVTRLAFFERSQGVTSHVLGVSTDREEIEVYVSRTGRIRVFRKGKRHGEMKVTS